MNLERIKKEFMDHGWRYETDYDMLGRVHRFRKGEFGVMFVSSSVDGLVFSGANPMEAEKGIYIPDDNMLVPIGDLMSFDFSNEKILEVRLYEGTLLRYHFFDNESFIMDDIQRKVLPPVKKPLEEYNVDDRPHKMIVEVSMVMKTYVAVFAHDEKEAISLVDNLDGIGEETYEREIRGHMETEDWDHFRVVKEFKNIRYDDPVISEYNVRI